MVEKKRRERARRMAERAKQRYKDLAVFGIIVIGVIVGVHEEASGNGTAFAAASAIGVMIVLGIVLGIVALAIRIDHRRRQ
jgi:hypothetical protein